MYEKAKILKKFPLQWAYKIWAREASGNGLLAICEKKVEIRIGSQIILKHLLTFWGNLKENFTFFNHRLIIIIKGVPKRWMNISWR